MEAHEHITITEYQMTATRCRHGTWVHDISQNRNMLVHHYYRPLGLPLHQQPSMVIVTRKS